VWITWTPLYSSKCRYVLENLIFSIYTKRGKEFGYTILTDEVNGPSKLNKKSALIGQL
jgi:hypothetical protein